MYMLKSIFFFKDEASDLEACQMLTTNAQNLMSTTSDALYHTQSASIRVALATRKEMGLLYMAETDPITGKLSQHHKVGVVTLAHNSLRFTN